jgi:hypothetical protein
LDDVLRPIDIDLDDADRLVELGRHKEALAVYAVAVIENVDRVRAAAWAARCCLELRTPHEALAWADWLAAHDAELGQLLQAAAYCQLQDYAKVVATASNLDPVGLARVGLGAENGVVVLAAAHLASGQYDDAERVLVAALSQYAHVADIWTFLSTVMAEQQHVALEVLAAFWNDPLRVTAFLRAGDVRGADVLLEAAWENQPTSSVVLAGASEIAPELDLERAVIWSARLREAGMIALCPLVRVARRTQRPEIDRIQAAIAVHMVFEDAMAEELIVAVCSTTSVSEIPIVLTVVADLAMDFLEVAVQAASHDPESTVTVAAFLLRGGAEDGAIYLLAQLFESHVIEAPGIRDDTLATTLAEVFTDDERTLVASLGRNHGLETFATYLSSIHR